MNRFAVLVLSCSHDFGAEKVRILSDEFGVPHIFVAMAAGGSEKLFNQARPNPTYFMRREELEKHVSGVKELTY